MENNLKDLGADLFSQILLTRRSPSHDQIAALEGEISSGEGPFASDGHNYAFDLRAISHKGSLSYGHPLLLRALVDNSLQLSSAIVPFILNKENLLFLQTQLSAFKNISFTPAPQGTSSTYNLNDFINKKKVKDEIIILQDLLFASSKELVPSEVFQFAEAKNYYLDLGIGAYLHFGESFSDNHLPSLQSHLLNPFINFIKVVLLNEGNGRIAQIESTLNAKGIDTCGVNIMNKQISPSKPIITNSDILNITTSITNEQLNLLIEIICE
tara:strand:+ start:96451 stop:97257 length:807 start_codon:yes stop_codon:yes gene_type:complete